MVDQVLKNLMLDKLEAYVHSGVHGLRDHQVEAVLSSDAADMNNMVRFLRQPNQPREEGALVQPKQFDGGSTQMATGTGKTHVELETAVGMCQPTREDPQGQRAIIVSPRIAINSHISRTYVSPQGLHCSQDDIGIYDSSRSVAEQQHALRARYLVTTRAGFESLHDKGLISSDPKNGHYRPLVILDESDTFLGYESGRILRGEAGLSRHDIETTDLKDLPGYVQNSIVLGFTATDYGVNHHLFGDQPTIHSFPLVPAVKRGKLAHGINVASFQVKPEDAGVEDYVRQQWAKHRHRPNLQEGSEQEEAGSIRAAERYAMDSAVIHEMIRFHSQHVDKDIGPIRNMPTLVSAPTINAAKRIAEQFNLVFGEDYALAVSGNTPRKDVRKRQTQELTEGLDSIVQRFNDQTELVDEKSGARRRAPRILVFPDVLGRGVDIPNATVLLSCRNYMTPRLPEQHLGRITREQNENYFDLFGCDKVALAANFTLPGILPWRFRDIIKGNVVYDDTRPRRPAPKSPAPLPPPNLPEPAREVRATITKEDWGMLLAEEESRPEELLPGWYTVDQAAQISGLPVDEVARRARGIMRNRTYTLQGLPAEGEEPTTAGSDLKRNFGHRIVLSNMVVDAWRAAVEKEKQLRGEGHLTAEELAEKLGVPVEQVRKQLAKVIKGSTAEPIGDAQPSPELRAQLEAKDDKSPERGQT